MIVNFLKHDLQFNMEPGFHFGKLCVAFKELSKFHQLGNDKDMKDCPPIYTPKTAVEFHYLLLGTIAGFKSTLNSFNLSPESEPFDKHTLYDVCWKITHLLWRISHSSILWEHLLFLNTAKLLHPDSNNGGVHGMDVVDQNDASNVDLGDESNVDGSGLGPDQEISVLGTLSNSQGDIPLMLLRWIHLLISHLTLFNTLLLFLQHNSLEHKKIHINMIAVWSPPKKVTLPWIPIFQHVSKSALVQPDIDAAVRMINECIWIYQEKHVSSQKQSIFFWFNADKGTMEVVGTIHCEVALACLFAYLKEALNFTNKETQKKWIFGSMSVSAFVIFYDLT